MRRQQLLATLLAIFLGFALAVPGLSQPQVRVTGVDNITPATTTNPLPVQAAAGGATQDINVKQVNGATPAATAPLPVQITNGTNFQDATHGGYNNLLQGNAVLGNTNTLPVRASADGTNPIDATHGLYTNLLQGNAVISSTNAVPIISGGVAAANITNTTAAIAAVDTTVTLTAASSHITVKTDANAAVIYLDFTGGTATSADFKMDAGTASGGATFNYNGPAISAFHYLGASAAGNISVCAY